MRVAVICPHRNDRPEFLAQFKKYMAAQTHQPDEVLYVNYKPESANCDITQRYRRGYETLSANYNLDLVLFCEVDDWYSPNYIETMVVKWQISGKPNIFSISSSIYYHISGKWFKIGRPSANTFLLKLGQKISFGYDDYPYVDVTLSESLTHEFKMCQPSDVICIGIKHGIGMVGGGCHNADNGRYINDDTSGNWLRSIVGDENYEFYASLRMKEGITKC